MWFCCEVSMKLKFIDNNIKQLVLFDIDGVLAEFVSGEEQAICNEISGVYLNKRPLKSIIAIAEELSKQQNITIGVLSSCEYKSQEIEKYAWLEQYASFIERSNIHIIVWCDREYTRENRKYAKLEFIEKIEGYDKIFLIEDKHDIIKTTNARLPQVAHHISELVE